MRKVKRISQHDINELLKFKEYLSDIESKMPREQFYRKYQEYMGLSDTEVQQVISNQQAFENVRS